MGFSRQEHWSGWPCPPLGGLPDPGIEPSSPVSPALQADSLLLSHRGSPDVLAYLQLKLSTKSPDKVARHNNFKFSEILNVSLIANIPPLGTRTLYNHMN